MATHAVYFDPSGRTPSEYELYDLGSDPDEALNLVDKRTGAGRTLMSRRLEACARAAVCWNRHTPYE